MEHADIYLGGIPWNRAPPLLPTLLGLVRATVRTRVRNGEVTERGLALRAGISQPYLYNVLKGARQMTTDLADRLLRELDLTVADLLPHDGAGQDRARASR